MTTAARSRHQALIVFLLTLNFGIVFFDRNALNYLMPFIAPDLQLTNTQVGLLASALSLTWAISGLVVGHFADRSGRRKTLLVAAIVVFSLSSFLSGLATSFLILLGARLLMGLAEGPQLPISQSLIALETPEKHRGLYMGIVQNFGSNLLGSFVAPLVLVAVANSFDWRAAFYFAALPGLLSALLIWRYVPEPDAADAQHLAETSAAGLEPEPPVRQSALGALGLLRYRNVLLCVLISIFSVPYLVIAWAFLPLYFTEVRGLSSSQMSVMMSILGLSATVGSFTVSALSDRIGRKPVMTAFAFIGVVLPLAALYYQGSMVVLGALFFVGWGICSAFPLFMSTIPAETVPPLYLSTSLGLVQGLGEIIGGFGGPAFAGWMADLYGLSAPLVIMLGCAVISGLLSLGLRETAPAKLLRAQPVPAAG